MGIISGKSRCTEKIDNDDNLCPGIWLSVIWQISTVASVERAISSFRIQVPVCQTTRHHFPEDSCLRIVTYRPTARQRLDKHVPAETDSR
jgi:hypothetical protein